MKKVLQINTGDGWCDLTSEFYDKLDQKEKAQAALERAAANWAHNYHRYRNAQFRIVDEEFGKIKE